MGVIKVITNLNIIAEFQAVAAWGVLLIAPALEKEERILQLSDHLMIISQEQKISNSRQVD